MEIGYTSARDGAQEKSTVRRGFGPPASGGPDLLRRQLLEAGVAGGPILIGLRNGLVLHLRTVCEIGPTCCCGVGTLLGRQKVETGPWQLPYDDAVWSLLWREFDA